jgi:hypothetical protein
MTDVNVHEAHVESEAAGAETTIDTARAHL